VCCSEKINPTVLSLPLENSIYDLNSSLVCLIVAECNVSIGITVNVSNRGILILISTKSNSMA
jgi:hypothetical protein